MYRLISLEDEQELPDGSIATRYRFTHALYQYHAYDQLLNKRKALLHRRAGETLERLYADSMRRWPRLWPPTSTAAVIFQKR